MARCHEVTPRPLALETVRSPADCLSDVDGYFNARFRDRHPAYCAAMNRPRHPLALPEDARSRFRCPPRLLPDLVRAA